MAIDYSDNIIVSNSDKTYPILNKGTIYLGTIYPILLKDTIYPILFKGTIYPTL